MFNTLLLAFHIDSTYALNTIIYRLKRLPIVKYIIPSSLYANDTIKTVISILILLFKILFEFTKKAIYIGVMIYLPATLLGNNIGGNFLHLFFALSLFGCICNTQLLHASTKKYYSIILMRMDAKKYAISHYIFYIFTIIITYLPPLLLFLSMANIPLFYTPILLLLTITLKLLGESFSIHYYRKKRIVFGDQLKIMVWMSLLLLLPAYALCYLSLVMPTFALLAMLPLFLIGSIVAGIYLLRLSCYKEIYKKVITYNKIIFKVDQTEIKTKQSQTLMDHTSLDLDHTISKKNGFEYFNAIFFSRHKRILLNSAKKLSLISLILALGSGILLLLYPAAKPQVNNVIMTYLPYFVFILYMINRGSTITQAMFFNCDHSMLTYSFYKKPANLLSLFKTRLKMLIKVNLYPASVIGCALPILLYISGGTANPFVYLSLFVSILALSIFFSVHHLVIYYLLQPYDIEMSAKSSMYSIVNSLTYLACYFCIRITADTMLFSIGIIVLTIIYVVLSLAIIYRYAPKTFQLKS